MIIARFRSNRAILKYRKDGEQERINAMAIGDFPRIPDEFYDRVLSLTDKYHEDETLPLVEFEPAENGISPESFR